MDVVMRKMEGTGEMGGSGWRGKGGRIRERKAEEADEGRGRHREA